MKGAGFNWLAYGFESVTDPKFRKTEDVIRMTRHYGINIIANFMFGLPNTTRDDDKRSVEFAHKHLFEWVNFYDALPYPGSQWYQDERRKIPSGVADDWAEFGQYKNIGLFRQKSFETYFDNPDYLNMIQQKWGKQAVNQIKAMRSFRFESSISSANASV